MCESEPASSRTWIVVYHPGTDWYPAFSRQCQNEPLSQLAGLFSDKSTMLLFLKTLRKVVTKDIVFKVLIPANYLLVVPGEVTLSPDLMPIHFECHNDFNGNPYTHPNFPGVPDEVFRFVKNVSKEPQLGSRSRWIAANSGAWAKALPVAAKWTIVGVVGVSCAFVVCGVCASFALVASVPVAMGGAGWAAYEAGMASKESVRNGFEKKNKARIASEEDYFRELSGK